MVLFQKKYVPSYIRARPLKLKCEELQELEQVHLESEVLFMSFMGSRKRPQLHSVVSSDS